MGVRMAALLGGLVALAAGPAIALNATRMPAEIQTKETAPVEREINLKLPLEQAESSWVFKNREDLLAGKLLLRIIRDKKPTEIVIFEEGRFSEGWRAMPVPPPAPEGVYFGFESTKKYATAPRDGLELELTVVKDLEGVSPSQTGVLAAGRYTSKGVYSGLVDEYDVSAIAVRFIKAEGRISDEGQRTIDKLHEIYDYKAFLDNWAEQWPLKITRHTGWLTSDRSAKQKAPDGEEPAKAREAQPKPDRESPRR